LYLIIFDYKLTVDYKFLEFNLRRIDVHHHLYDEFSSNFLIN